jgi:hypothetical protein
MLEPTQTHAKQNKIEDNYALIKAEFLASMLIGFKNRYNFSFFKTKIIQKLPYSDFLEKKAKQIETCESFKIHLLTIKYPK